MRKSVEEVVVAYWEVFRLAAPKNKIQSLRIDGSLWNTLEL
jgi:hypothetical protein